MGTHNFFARIAYKLRAFMVLQLFITCISLPILVAWGLPLSLLSPLGNLIFSPFLTAFLSLSSLLFFTQLLCIPNAWIAYALNTLTHAWLFCLKQYPPGMLIAFTQPPWFVLIIVPICAIIITAHPKTRDPNKSIVLLSATLFIFCFGLKLLCTTSTDIFDIPCNNAHVLVIRHGNENIVIDPGAIGRRASGPSWVQYNLLPALAKQSGLRHIDHLILCKINKTTFESIAALARIAPIKHVYVPYWSGEFKKGTLWAFMQLKNALAETGGTIIRLGTHKHTVSCGPHIRCTIEHTNKKITYQNGMYHASRIVGWIDNAPIPFYDANTLKSAQFIQESICLNKKKDHHDQREGALGYCT